MGIRDEIGNVIWKAGCLVAAIKWSVASNVMRCFRNTAKCLSCAVGIKMCAVLFLTILHMFIARWRKDFEKGKNIHSAKFYKIINEIPTILMILAVILVIVKPFE